MTVALHTPSCHGCKHVVYSARYGQAHDRTPHSRCGELARNIPMVLGEHDSWKASEVPKDCPVHFKQL